MKLIGASACFIINATTLFIMRLLHLAIAAGAIMTAVLPSCVSKKQYASLQAEHTALQQDYTTLKTNYDKAMTKNQTIDALLNEARANNEELKRQYASLQASLDKSISQNTQGNVNISKLVDEINASNKYIKQLVQAKTKSDSLNLLLATNLTRSLSPDDMDEVNVKVLKGVVYISLADNMLFKSGSYKVNDRAKTTLSKIAKIIKDYKDYDVMVEGNTDPVPISRTNIRNNWDLSTLRASSIVQILQNDYGVDPGRLTAAGRGEFNPIADNSTAEGRQRNRRTEIIITPKLDQFLDLIDKAPKDSQESQASVPTSDM